MNTDEPTTGTWIETYSGKRVDVENPDPATIEMGDIAHSLARVARFCGHSHTPGIWSVAQHSLVVERYVAEEGYGPRLRLLGLLHDAHEAYVGDRAAPQKRLLPQHLKWEDALQAAIWEAIDIAPPTLEEAHLIEHADRIALASEADWYMASGGGGWEIGADPQPHLLWHFDQLTCSEAAMLFTRTLGHLLGEIRRRCATTSENG